MLSIALGHLQMAVHMHHVIKEHRNMCTMVPHLMQCKRNRDCA